MNTSSLHPSGLQTLTFTLLNKTNDIRATIHYTKNKSVKNRLRALTTQPACKCKILRLDGNTLRVDSSKVGVFKEGYEVGFRRLLQGHHSR